MIDRQLALLLGLTFVINLVGSLAYSVRIAGIRAGRIAVSLSLFNVLLLVSRTANSFRAPLLARRVEGSLAAGAAAARGDFRWMIAATSAATLVGALLTPTFQRLFTRAVHGFAQHRSLGRVLLRGLQPAAWKSVRLAATVPTPGNLTHLSRRPRPPLAILVINTIATGIWTVGVLAALYAAYLNPGLRATSSNLSGLVNGAATILLFVVVDPHLSLMTDDVLEGKASEPFFRRCVVWMLGSRLAGTVLAQLLLVPAAALIGWAAARL